MACCPFARLVYHPDYDALGHRCCSERIITPIERHSAPRHLTGMWRKYPRGMLVVGDSLAEQAFLGILCQLWEEEQQLPTFNSTRYPPAVTSSPMQGCHSFNYSKSWHTTIWPVTEVARMSVPSYRISFARQECPELLNSIARVVGDFDIVLLGTSAGHTSWNGPPATVLLSALLHNVVDAFAHKPATVLLMETLPDHSPNAERTICRVDSVNTKVSEYWNAAMCRVCTGLMNYSMGRNVQVAVAAGAFDAYARLGGAHVQVGGSSNDSWHLRKKASWGGLGYIDCVHWCVPVLPLVGRLLLNDALNYKESSACAVRCPTQLPQYKRTWIAGKP